MINLDAKINNKSNFKPKLNKCGLKMELHNNNHIFKYFPY